MAGSAGSKYGIVDDEIPIKRNGDDVDANRWEDHADELRDIRSLIHARALKSKSGDRILAGRSNSSNRCE